MSAERADPFADDIDLSDFRPKPALRPQVSKEAIREVSEQNNFPSRAAAGVVLPRQQRRRRTGRNTQVNVKATPETAARFNRIAEARGLALGELLERALDAFERAEEQR